MSVRVLLLSVCWLAVQTGCSDSDSKPGNANVGVAISALTAAEVQSVTITVTAPDITTPITADLVPVGANWQGTIHDIPAGTDRHFMAQAFDGSHTVLFEGAADHVTIVAGTTAVVMIVLHEATPPGPFENRAPYITSFWISSDDVAPSADVTLGVQAIDPDGDPLVYEWTGTGGSFTTPGLTDTRWQAPATDGTYSLQIRVSDPHGAADTLATTIAVQTPTAGSAVVHATFNLAPRIFNISSTLSRLQDGGAATGLGVVGNDPDGDALSYSWTANCGGDFGEGFPSQAPSTQFTLHDAAATSCAFTVTVRDARGGEATGTLHLPTGAPPPVNLAIHVSGGITPLAGNPSGAGIKISEQHLGRGARTCSATPNVCVSGGITP